MSLENGALGDAEVIALNVMWNRLISVCEEQANALLRVAFGAIVREAGDLSAGVFDAGGRMMAQAVTGTPGHVNTMARSVNAMLAHVPARTLAEGDVLVTNDPWLGAGHVFDFVVVTPVFRGGRIVAYLASTCHVVDVGGLGWSAEARSVFEEGVVIPVTRLRKAGVLNDELLDIVATNSRVPREARGDIISLMACNDEGARRLTDLMDEYAIAGLERLAGFIFERSRGAMLDAVAAVPEGVYENTIRLDGYDAPLTLRARMTVGGGRIAADLAGSDRALDKGVNCPLVYSQAYASFGIKALVAPHVPNNHASLALIEITAPPGLVVSAERPRPVTARHVVGQALPDLMLGCLARALPGRVLAESAGALWVLAISGEETADGQPGFASINVALGGMGARAGADGLSTTAFPSGVGSVPVEIAETVAPLIYVAKEFAPDTGGAGRLRGGLGQEIRLRAATDRPLTLSAAAFERLREGAAGREGGQSGSPGGARISDGRVIDSKGLYTIPPGEELILRTPGGGGFGPPEERARDAVRRDLALGLIGRAAASDIYRCAGEPAQDPPTGKDNT
ncbi:hydantoinase B/oxoprolinase family protein (plasmid) [Paroceanicella profunda]|uniref:Hydantoinase B/oxoprolinase family protein n=1 Tax=Paroceanicella profunda TaxID=2579971 RepID=A0A5B8G670_9RHOB|nr:hydantoinase B/oxoprolinase family protein [Paroceanicella profunda]QDL94922.1 hydantoinase B/oxoprolinase family protein [Paroceanicella profunda]